MMDLPTCLYEPDGDIYRPTGLTRGPWDPGSSMPGRRRRYSPAPSSAPAWITPGQSGRLGFDILRPVPVAPHRIATRTLRPGATWSRSRRRCGRGGGEALMRLSAWRLRREELELPPGSPRSTLPHPRPDGRSSLPSFWTEPVAYHAALDWSFVAGEFDEPGPRPRGRACACRSWPVSRPRRSSACW